MIAKLTKNYQKGRRTLLKGTIITVTPWFYEELVKGGYLDEEKPKEKVKKPEPRKVETRTN